MLGRTPDEREFMMQSGFVTELEPVALFIIPLFFILLFSIIFFIKKLGISFKSVGKSVLFVFAIAFSIVLLLTYLGSSVIMRKPGGKCPSPWEHTIFRLSNHLDDMGLLAIGISVVILFFYYLARYLKSRRLFPFAQRFFGKKFG